tara:strand:+ start:1483 stop:2016 length:534 start_codon:yes stop_codon:yes gene_type:complete
MNMLKGKIISLRKVKFEDLKFLRDWRNTRVIWENNTQFILLNLKQQNLWFKKINSNISKEKMFTVIDEKQNPIGICGLVQIDEDNKNAKIAIIIGNTKNHSKGIGTESLNLLLSYGFNKLKIHRIDAEVIEYNKKSLNFFKKLGFKQEAVMRDYIFRNGKWWNLFIFSKISNVKRHN